MPASSTYKAALKLNPHSAIARIEYANGLVMMFEGTRMAEARSSMRRPRPCAPLDAMERLDVELAKSQLKD